MTDKEAMAMALEALECANSPNGSTYIEARKLALALDMSFFLVSKNSAIGSDHPGTVAVKHNFPYFSGRVYS